MEHRHHRARHPDHAQTGGADQQRHRLLQLLRLRHRRLRRRLLPVPPRLRRPADWAACSSPTSYSSLADGAHSFEVRAHRSAPATPTRAPTASNGRSMPPHRRWGSTPALTASPTIQPRPSTSTPARLARPSSARSTPAQRALVPAQGAIHTPPRPHSPMASTPSACELPMRPRTRPPQPATSRSTPRRRRPRS